MKYFRKLMSYIATRLIIITLCISLLVCAFYMAYNLGNAYVLINEGMEKRVSVVLTREDATDLNDYFTTAFLENDPVLTIAFSDSSPYLPYTITGFDYSVSISGITAWPWSSEIRCTVVESVKNITGTVKAAYATQVSGAPSQWKSGRYTIRLSKQANGQWKIAAMEQDASYKDTEE